MRETLLLAEVPEEELYIVRVCARDIFFELFSVFEFLRRAKVSFFLVWLMIQILFRKLSFSFWTVLSMSISDNVVEGAWRTSAADSAVGIQRRDSL